MNKTTLADRYRQRVNELSQQRRIALDQEWQQRSDSGQTLIDILQGKHWEGTKPSERSSEQVREALFSKFRNKYAKS